MPKKKKTRKIKKKSSKKKKFKKKRKKVLKKRKKRVSRNKKDKTDAPTELIIKNKPEWIKASLANKVQYQKN